jgi:sulfate permease, SulP family
VGGLAGGGSLSQTAVNEGAGARSEVSPFVATLLALVTVLALTPLFTDLPEAVLAALIIHAVSHLWKISEFRRYYGLRPVEFWLGLLTLAGVITLDVLPGLAIGVTSMLLLVVYRASRPHVGALGRVADSPGAFLNLDRHPDAQPIPGVLMLRVDSPLFYANANLVRDRVKELVGAAHPLPTTVILELGASDELDVTAAETLDELAITLHAAGIDLALADVHRPVIEIARRAGLIQAIGTDHVFSTVQEAVDTLRNAR